MYTDMLRYWYVYRYARPAGHRSLGKTAVQTSENRTVLAPTTIIPCLQQEQHHRLQCTWVKVNWSRHAIFVAVPLRAYRSTHPPLYQSTNRSCWDKQQNNWFYMRKIIVVTSTRSVIRWRNCTSVSNSFSAISRLLSKRLLPFATFLLSKSCIKVSMMSSSARDE